MHYPTIIGQKWKPDQCNYCSQLSHDLGSNKTGLTWLLDMNSGERNKKGFPAKSADHKALEATTVTPGWVVKNDRIRSICSKGRRGEQREGSGAFWILWHLTHVCFSQGKILATCNTGAVGTMHTSLASGNLEWSKGKIFSLEVISWYLSKVEVDLTPFALSLLATTSPSCFCAQPNMP